MMTLATEDKRLPIFKRYDFYCFIFSLSFFILAVNFYYKRKNKSLTKIKSANVKIITENKTVEGNYIFGMICNTFSVGGLLKIDRDDVSLDDGKFEAIFVKKHTFFMFFNKTLFIIFIV